jgi:hypothetical protein
MSEIGDIGKRTTDHPAPPAAPIYIPPVPVIVEVVFYGSSNKK